MQWNNSRYGTANEHRTFSSVGMVSLSLAIRLDTCSMPRLRNSSLPTTSGKCCSVSRWNKLANQFSSDKPALLRSQPLTRITHARTCEAVCLREELRAGVQVCEGPYSKTIGRMKLGAQEFTAGFFYLVQLEQACCGQQRLSHTHTHFFFFLEVKKAIQES